MKILDNQLKLLKVDQIQPQGWYKQQLLIQARSLGGNLHKFWPDIKDSKWIGGTREGWERVPYWLDGYIPLAWLLDDEAMKQTARQYVYAIIDNQKADGWLCPCEDHERGGYDTWAALLILKTLTVFADCDGDQDLRVQNAVEKALRQLDLHLDGSPLFGWGQMRWYEGLIACYWLYEKTGADWIGNVVVKLRCQGFDYYEFFKHWPYKDPDKASKWGQLNHIVNNLMMLKGYALYYRFSKDPKDLEKTVFMLGELDKYHGMVTGAISGDECLSGLSPVQGSELCSIVEFMYSLQTLTAVTGETKWMDRLEQLAFNCLPATFSPDMWTHQYDQQVNQMQCVESEPPVFKTNGKDANLFGLEPHYGCCTSNFHQGWPKLAFNAVMQRDDGYSVMSYLPCTVTIDDVKLEIVTDYPFRRRVTVRIESGKRQTIRFRIPQWATAVDAVNATKESESIYVANVSEGARVEVTLTFEDAIAVLDRPYGNVAITKGPFVYSLKIDDAFTQINQDVEGREFPHCDYEVRPLTKWNYALADTDFAYRENDLRPVPFSPQNAPNTIVANCQEIGWDVKHGSCAAQADTTRVCAEVIQKEFIPYGCTNLRITELKLLRAKK